MFWLVATVTFFLMHSTPGSPWDARNAANGGRLSPLLRESFERRYGLNRSLPEQYLIYLGNAVRLDFGESYTQQGQTVAERIMLGFPYSARIGLFALILAVVLGVPLGVVAALRQNTWVDYVSLFFATIGATVPSFVIAIFLMILVAVKLEWVPVLWQIPTDWRNYILPSVVLGLAASAFIARLTRANILEILRQDYVRTARAKGLQNSTVNLRHVLRNGMIPVVTILGPALAGLITGTIIIENVFGVPGMGYLFIQSVQGRDYPVIMGTTLFYTFFVVIGNLMVDITYGLLDPRIQTS
ncbi:MAG: ABC transporter permease [Chloroflexota bacterium]|nr:ABC transporter permease [Chloroflexota bacterium]